MNTEEKVASLELSKQLKEAGAKQESQYCWCTGIDPSTNKPFHLLMHGGFEYDTLKKEANTFDSTELLERLPKKVNDEDGKPHVLSLFYSSGQYVARYRYVWGEHDDSAAEALGELYRWCLEEGHCSE